MSLREVNQARRAGRTRRGKPVSCLSVKLRRGRTGPRLPGILGSAALRSAALRSAVLAAAVALAAAGCSSAEAPTKAAAGTTHALTLAEARSIFSSYVARSTAAAEQGDAAKGLPLAGDMQWAILHAQYTALDTSHAPVAQYRYGTPVFYVPALAGYPLWFMVAVPVTTDTGGQLGPAVTTLMVFQRYTPSRTWTLNGSVVLDKPLPAIQRDSDGYAVAVGDADPSLLLPPDLVGATQAAVVDEGPTAPAAAVIGAGPQTTGLYTTQDAQGNSAAAHGLNYQWLLQGASYAQYELAAAGGGALVLYSMYLNTQLEHPGNLAGPPIPAPANFVPLITTPAKAGPHGVVENWTYEFAAIDPPQTAQGAKVEVIGGRGAPTYGKPY
jgi:hypothetical protein